MWNHVAKNLKQGQNTMMLRTLGVQVQIMRRELEQSNLKPAFVFVLAQSPAAGDAAAHAAGRPNSRLDVCRQGPDRTLRTRHSGSPSVPAE